MIRAPVLVAAALLLAGCGSGSHGAAGGTAAAITSFSAAPEHVNESFATLNRLARSEPAALRAAALGELSSGSPAVRYAAVYALSLTATRGSALDALARVLRSRDPSERLLAAQTLVAQRDRRGVPVLIDALDSNARFAHWAPPRQAWEVAQHALLRFVPADLGLRRARTIREAAVAKRAWTRWWASHASEVRLKPARIGSP
jgi:HEAT repeat protein